MSTFPNTKALLACQTKYEELCNADELQFQIVHQPEELWMKLIGYTLLDIDDYLQQENTNRVITLFRRVHLAQNFDDEQLALLETMSPKEYQAIRTRLGNGSGQESPGFRVLLKMYQPIWYSFKTCYLEKHDLDRGENLRHRIRTATLTWWPRRWPNSTRCFRNSGTSTCS